MAIPILRNAISSTWSKAKRPYMCKLQLVCILRFIYAETNIFCDSSSARPDFERGVAPFPSQFFAISLLFYEHILIALLCLTSQPLDRCLCMLTWISIEQIKKLQRNGTVEHEISIIWLPRRTLVSNKILEDEGVLGDVSISELPLYFLALENDVLSLEWEDSFSDLYLVC